jgi:hypothetical protein
MQYWQFTSTSISQSFALSWPFQTGATRLLLIYRERNDDDAGSFLGYLQSPYQLEVAFAPGLDMTMIGCQRMQLADSHGRQHQLGLGFVVASASAAQLSNQTYVDNVIAMLRTQFAIDAGSCSPLFCAFDFASRPLPRIFECDKGMLGNDPFANVASSSCVATNDAYRNAFRLLLGGWIGGPGALHKPQCVTVDNKYDYTSISECNARFERQRWLVDGSQRLRYDSVATDRCLSNYGARFYPNSDARLWSCNSPVTDDQLFHFDHSWNMLQISTISRNTGVAWCLDANCKFNLCSSFGASEWMLVPVNITLP